MSASEDKLFSPMLRSHATTDSTYHCTSTLPTLHPSLCCLTTTGGVELQTATRTTATTSSRFFPVLFLGYFCVFSSSSFSRWQMRTLKVASSLLLDPGWVMEVQTISGEAGTVPQLLVHSARSASFPGAKMRRLEKLTATTLVGPVTLTTRATGLHATMISYTPKL